jgi:hypothetical protein
MNITIFAQILQRLPKNKFQSLVKKYQSDKHNKGVDSWTQLVAMLFCQFSKSNSLRDIHYGLNSATGNLNHYGVEKSPPKSSLGYENKHRTWKLFRDFYMEVVKSLNLSRNDKGRLKLKRKIFLLDSTLINLCLEIFDWAKYRARKGAIKLHTVLDYDGCLPVFVEMTDGLKHDTTVAKQFTFPAGSVVVADRGYLDFPLMKQWDDEQVFFVIRCKESVRFIEMEDQTKSRKMPGYENIRGDLVGELELDPSYKKYPKKLRMVVVYDPQTDQYLELLTNNFNWTATTVAQLYKNRWDIENFFKDIKTHLKIKSFVGTSANAVLIQIWTALITIALMKGFKAIAKHKWHLSNLINFLRLNLFVKIELQYWLDHPFVPEKPPNESVQYAFF